MAVIGAAACLDVSGVFLTTIPHILGTGVTAAACGIITYTPENSFISNNDSYAIQTHKVKRKYDNQDNFKKDLIKIFIYIFYYEKICSEKNGNIFKKRDRFCLAFKYSI